MKDKVEFAGNAHTARAGANGSTISLKDKQLLGYTPSDGEVRLGVVTGNYPTQADTVTDNEFSGMIADRSWAILQCNDTSTMALSNNYAGISVQNEAASLTLVEDEASMEAGTVIIKTKSGRAHKLTIDNAGIHIDGLDMENNKIKTNGQLELQGGIIKIG